MPVIESFSPPLRTEVSRKNLQVVYHKDTTLGLAYEANSEGELSSPLRDMPLYGYIEFNGEEFLYEKALEITNPDDATDRYPYIENPDPTVAPGVRIPVAYVNIRRRDIPFTILTQDGPLLGGVNYSEYEVASTDGFPLDFVALIGAELARALVVSTTRIRVIWPMDPSSKNEWPAYVLDGVFNSDNYTVNKAGADRNPNTKLGRNWKAGTFVYVFSYSPGYPPFTFSGSSKSANPNIGSYMLRTGARYSVELGQRDKLLQRLRLYLPSFYYEYDSDKSLSKFLDSMDNMWHALDIDTDISGEMDYSRAKAAWLPYLIRDLGWETKTGSPQVWRWQARYLFELLKGKGRVLELKPLLKFMNVLFSYKEKWRDQNGNLTAFDPEVLNNEISSTVIDHYKEDEPLDGDELAITSDLLYHAVTDYGVLEISESAPWDTVVDESKTWEPSYLAGDPSVGYYYIRDSGDQEFRVVDNGINTLQLDTDEILYPTSIHELPFKKEVWRDTSIIDASRQDSTFDAGRRLKVIGPSISSSWAKPWDLNKFYGRAVKLKLVLSGGTFKFGGLTVTESFSPPIVPKYGPELVELTDGTSEITPGTYRWKYLIEVGYPDGSSGYSFLGDGYLQETLTSSKVAVLVLPPSFNILYFKSFNIYRTKDFDPDVTPNPTYYFVGKVTESNGLFLDTKEDSELVEPYDSTSLEFYNHPYFTLSAIGSDYWPLGGNRGFVKAWYRNVIGQKYCLATGYYDRWQEGIWADSELILPGITNNLNEAGESKYWIYKSGADGDDNDSKDHAQVDFDGTFSLNSSKIGRISVFKYETAPLCFPNEYDLTINSTPDVLTPSLMSINFDARLSSTSLSGAVVDKSSGEAVNLPNIPLNLINLDNGVVYTITTGTTGEFQFYGLAPGNYRLVPYYYSEGPAYYWFEPMSLNLTLASGEAREIEFERIRDDDPESYVSLTGEVLELGSSTPQIEGASVAILRLGDVGDTSIAPGYIAGGANDMWLTSSDASFTFNNLVPGRYALYVYKKGFKARPFSADWSPGAAPYPMFYFKEIVLDAFVNGGNTLTENLYMIALANNTNYNISGAFTFDPNIQSQVPPGTEVMTGYNFYTNESTFFSPVYGPNNAWKILAHQYREFGSDIEVSFGPGSYVTGTEESLEAETYVVNGLEPKWTPSRWIGGSLMDVSNRTVLAPGDPPEKVANRRGFSIISSNASDVVVLPDSDQVLPEEISKGAILLRQPIEGRYWMYNDSGKPRRRWYGREGGTTRVPYMPNTKMLQFEITSPSPYQVFKMSTKTKRDMPIPVKIRIPQYGISMKLKIYLDGKFVFESQELTQGMSGDHSFIDFSVNNLGLEAGSHNVNVCLSPFYSNDVAISCSRQVDFVIRK